MKKIGIITEDACSLPEKLIRDFGIEIVKLYFPEWEKFPEKNLYQLMKETKATSKTSAPPPGEYLSAYKKLDQEFEKILVITVSSKLSACFNSAFQAKELFEKPEKVFIFNSLQTVCGQGLLVLKAAELIEEGKEIDEILKILENLKKKIKLFGFLKNLLGRKNWQSEKMANCCFSNFKRIGCLSIFGNRGWGSKINWF